MQITEYRTKEILNWLDDKAIDHTLLFEEITLFRDAASLVRQLQAAEQSAWHAGLDAGREQGRGNEHHRAEAQAHPVEWVQGLPPNNTLSRSCKND